MAGNLNVHGWGGFWGEFAPLLSTAMEVKDLDTCLDSRLMLHLPVGPDCHSGVLVSSKNSAFVSEWSGDES